MADPIVITLSAPITAHGETLNELRLRAPTVKELRQCGQPYRLAGGGVSADYDACHRLLTAICAIPPSSVDQLAASDFDGAAMALMGFTMSGQAPAGAPPAASASTG